MGGAFLGGLVSGVPCSLWELTMIQQQRFGGSIFGTPARLVADHGGVSAMSRGLLTSCGREGIYTAGVLGTCPVFAGQLEARGFEKTSAKLLAAIGAGVISASLSHPMDTIKTCQQGDIAGATYGGIGDTFAALMKEGGPARFFSGFGFRTGRMILSLIHI